MRDFVREARERIRAREKATQDALAQARAEGRREGAEEMREQAAERAAAETSILVFSGRKASETEVAALMRMQAISIATAIRALATPAGKETK